MQQLRRRSFFSGNSRLEPRMSETYAIDRFDFREVLREPSDADHLNHCSLMQNIGPKGCTIAGEGSSDITFKIAFRLANRQ